MGGGDLIGGIQEGGPEVNLWVGQYRHESGVAVHDWTYVSLLYQRCIQGAEGGVHDHWPARIIGGLSCSQPQLLTASEDTGPHTQDAHRIRGTQPNMITSAATLGRPFRICWGGVHISRSNCLILHHRSWWSAVEQENMPEDLHTWRAKKEATHKFQ